MLKWPAWEAVVLALPTSPTYPMLKILSIYLTLGLVSASTWTYPIHRRDDVTLRRPTSFATFGEQLTSVVK